MKNNASLIYGLCLVVSDSLTLVLAFVWAYFVRAHLTSVPVAHQVHVTTYIGVFLVLLPFWILVFALLGLYNSNIYEKRFSEIGRLLIGSFIGMLFVIFWNYLSLHPILPSKLIPILGFVFSFVFLVFFRNIARLVRTLLFGYELGLTNVLIIGDTDLSEELIESLSNSKQSGYRVIGVVSSRGAASRNHKVRHFSSFDEATRRIDVESIHGIIQTELYADENRNREILDYAQGHHISYRFAAGNSELFIGNIDVELFRSSIPVIAVHQTALFGWGRIAKRLFDIFVGLIAFIIALPFMIIIAFLILIFDHGAILFRQERLTRFDTKIKIFKFRTIKKRYNGLSPEAAFAKMGKPELAEKYRKSGDRLSNDPRISSLGHFLRSTSLDELPQLINVIAGDISLVGPRALEPYELAQYPKKNLLLSVKSGLTGLAQVSGRRNIDFEERRKLDLYYVQNWSFWLDITILIKTVRAIVSRRGAM